MHWNLARVALTIAAVSWAAADTAAQMKAFPQAEGFGKYANGGRGGDVYHVTKLSDDGSVGTLRHGIESAPTSGRTIVFDVAGWIDLNSKLGIVSSKRNITIAGQTAPGGGIGVRGNQFSIGGDDIVVRHMRFRPGKGAGRVDAAGANVDAERIIYDHVSAGFSFDETFSTQATDLTLQYSSVAYGLESHSAGSLLENPHRVSMHHNLYAHNNTRNPKHRVQETLDWVNNVIYNWDNRAFYMEGTSGSGFHWTANVDGNYFIAGPNQGNTKPISGGSLDDYTTWFGVNAYDSDRDAQHDGVEYETTSRNWADFSSALTTFADSPFPTPEIWKDASPDDAYERVLAEFGATPWNRDEVDTYLHSTLVNRNGAIIERESDLPGISNSGFGTLAAGVAPTDTDGDGMPDEWEERHGTNPLRTNNNADFDQDGYTDLEEYLNDLAAFKAIGAVEFNGIGRYADWARWTNDWEPSRVDDVRVTTGAAFVDAVGQKAGTLTLGGSGGDGRLYVTSGWIEVTDTLTIDGDGRADQHGGEVRADEVAITSGAYRLYGGELKTPSLSKAAAGDFVFEGGTLATDAVDFDLTNNGGTLNVGLDQVGAATVAGDLNLLEGTLAVELEGVSLADQLQVSGDVVLGGVLDVQLVDGFLPGPGTSWDVLTGASITGAFDEVTPGYNVEVVGNAVRITVNGLVAIPEPGALCLAALAAGLVATRRRRGAAVFLAAALLMAPSNDASAVTIPVIADAQIGEDGGVSGATDVGSGFGDAINARWNFNSSPPDKNEWVALKFDLSGYDPAYISNVSLNTTMYRASSNNSKSLSLYALTPGTAGEDWDESTITYGSMPGFTFDANSSTNLLDTGGAIQSLDTFSLSGYESEGAVAAINPGTLTDLVQGMGDNDLLTVLISFASSSNGQWRIASREATSTDTGAVTGAAGDLAATLSFDFEPPSTEVLGDYNDDGVVDAADYTTWRDANPSTVLLNEEVSPGVTDIADYLFWAERYGATDTGQPSLAVPEPGTLAAAAISLFAAVGGCSRGRAPHGVC